MLGLAYEQKSMFEEAIAEFQKAIALSGGTALPIALLGHAYATSQKKDEALKVLDKLHELSKRGYVSSYRIAAIYAGLEEIIRESWAGIDYSLVRDTAFAPASFSSTIKTWHSVSPTFSPA